MMYTVNTLEEVPHDALVAQANPDGTWTVLDTQEEVELWESDPGNLGKSK